MLTEFPQTPVAGPRPPICWIDLLSPSAEELAEAERAVGFSLPTRETLSEIETSSRLRMRDGVLSMSAPMVSHDATGAPSGAPIGFVLSRERLVTIRYSPLRAFDAVAERLKAAGTGPTSSLEVFVELCDEIVDRVADSFESAAAELRGLSVATFHVPDSQGRKAIVSNRVIRGKLQHVGRLGDQVSEARDVLLGVGRAVEFACEMTSTWEQPALTSRMKSLRQDVASLADYEVHLTDKMQFLLDAMVGLIGIAQNDVFKMLTIVSIVGIPPTLFAGIYGMNFKYMPEYNWTFGYPFGLAVIAISALLPLVWFKWRGWF